MRRALIFAALAVGISSCGTPSLNQPPPSKAEQRLAMCPIIDPALLVKKKRLVLTVPDDKAPLSDVKEAVGICMSAYGALADDNDRLIDKIKGN